MKQLPPVKAIAITQGAVEMAIHDGAVDLFHEIFSRRSRQLVAGRYGRFTPTRVGLELIRGFKWMSLYTQHRSVDPVHTAFISRLWRGDAISVRDLMQYRMFSPADVDADPTWLSAPVLVATNQERFSLLHARAVSFARHHGTCVLRWQLDMRKWRGCPRDPEHRRNAMEDPNFYEYFVAGGPGFVTANICPMYVLDKEGVWLAFWEVSSFV
jgi:hypothetical protein